MASNFSFSDQSSFRAPRRRYDIFLSFRGADTRREFAYNLYKAFIAKGLHTFRDDDEIEGGKQVNPELMEAIEESTYSVLIISVNYADSSWCLNELLKILECSKTRGQTVRPIFYRVDPSDVRKQAGEFGKGFLRAVSKNKKNAPIWKKALEEIGSTKGGEYINDGHEFEVDFIEQLVLDIFIKLKDSYPYPLEGLVGMRPRMEEVINLLDLESPNARMVGLWGLGGSGKTTIARAVYDSIYWKFEGCSFIDVKAVSSRGGLEAVLERIILDTLKVKDSKLSSATTGTRVIRQRVCHKKVLIVLDGLDEKIDLDCITCDHIWYTSGSRIIVTTGNQQCLVSWGADLYEVPMLDDDESEELFRSKAFAEVGESENFLPLIDRAVKLSDGFPLALKVLGSSLKQRTPKQWTATLNRLERSPDDAVQKVLTTSYAGLKREDKNIFLDLCCFFRGKDKDEVINFLESCGFTPNIGVDNLVEKCFLKILDNNTLWMLDTVQKMGWTIVQETSPENPGERSRLCHRDDIKHVLMENTGTIKIEGICDNVPAIGTEDLNLRPNVFANMKKLRVLQISHKCPSIGLPNTLRYLYWHNYPLKCMPSTFKPEGIVELHLTNSCIKQLWDGVMVLPKLTVLDLSYSTCLTKSPDFTGFLNLDKLFLQGCTTLPELHLSLRKLTKLKILNLKGCEKLKAIPNGIQSQCFEIIIFSGCLQLQRILENFGELKKLSKLYLDGTAITEIPQTIGNSTGLCHLDLSRCNNLKKLPSNIGKLINLKKLFLRSCKCLSELPKEVGCIESLEVLDVSYSGIRKFQPSVVGLRNLQVLSLRECNGYPFPSLMYSFLEFFYPTWTTDRMTLVLPSLSAFESLTSLDLAFCGLRSVPTSVSSCLYMRELILTRNRFESLPTSIKDLNYLEKLWLRKCKKLKEIPELPSTVKYLMASGCESLKTVCHLSLLKDAILLCFSNCTQLVDNKEVNSFMEYNFLLKQIEVNGNEEFRVYTCPGPKIPEWFSKQNDGASIKFPLPHHNKSSNLLGIALSVVVSTKRKDCRIGVKIKLGDMILEDRWAFFFYKNVEDVCILYFPLQVPMMDGIYPQGLEFQICFSKAEYDNNLWKYMVDNVGNDTPPEVKRCGARLIYANNRKTISSYRELPSVKFEKLMICFKICLYLLILFIVYSILYN